MFDRNGDSLFKIKFLVVSQEPGASLREKCSNSEKIEEFLVSECNKNYPPKNRGLLYKIREIFVRKFNPKTDEIYWTHALRCVPIRNDDIRKQWKNCATYCVYYLKEELILTPSKQLTIIPIGGYALALCRHVLEDNKLPNVRGIMKYIKNANPEKKFNLGEKEIFLFPFLHPSNRERVLKRYDKNDEVKNKEKEFIKSAKTLNFFNVFNPFPHSQNRDLKSHIRKM